MQSAVQRTAARPQLRGDFVDGYLAAEQSDSQFPSKLRYRVQFAGMQKADDLFLDLL